MPRDSAGNYSLPPGNPVVAHTTVESDWANTTMDDISITLTDSLSRSGKGAMLAPFKFSDGGVAAPGISWFNEPTSGMYRAGTNDFRWSIFGQDVFMLAPSGIVLPAGKSLSGGSISSPISGSAIDNSVIGGTTPAAGSFTSVTTPLVTSGGTTSINAVGAGFLQVGGVAQYKWDAGKFAPDNALVNSRDLASAGIPWRTGYFGTSVVTPLVKAAVGDLRLETTGIPRAVILSDANNNFSPTQAMDLGTPALPWATGTFVTKVVTPLVQDNGASSLFLNATGGGGGIGFGQYAGVNKWRWDNAQFAPAADNAYNLGAPGLSWANGYFGTSVVVPLVNLANSATPNIIFVPSSGATKNAQIQQVGNLLNFNDWGTANRAVLDLVSGAFSVPGSVVTPLLTNGAGALTLTGGGTPWQINAGGHLVDLSGDNLHDVGIAGDRFRNANFGGTVSIGSCVLGPDSAVIGATTTDFSTKLLVRGTVTGIRIGTDVAGGSIAAVDKTGSVSFKPLTLSGDGINIASTNLNSIALAVNNNIALKIQSGGNGEWWSFAGVASGNSPIFASDGGDANVGGLYITKGTGSHEFRTNGPGGGSAAGSIAQVLVLHTALAARQLTFTGAPAGGNPTIGTTGGSINFSAPVSFSVGLGPAFESAEQALVRGTTITVAHGLGRLPKLFSCALRCKTAEQGFAVGDEIQHFAPYYDNPNQIGLGQSVDAVNMYAVLGGAGFTSYNRTSHGLVGLTEANWKLVLRAW